MKKLLVLIIIIFMSLVVLKIFVLQPRGWEANLINPATPTPISTPNAPKTYNFDSSSDLKKELDSVNPQVLDSDFE